MADITRAFAGAVVGRYEVPGAPIIFSRTPWVKPSPAPLLDQHHEEVLAEITTQARLSSEINQRSGVSVRVSIANYETMLGNALRRAIRNGEEWTCPRASDLSFIVASFAQQDNVLPRQTVVARLLVMEG